MQPWPHLISLCFYLWRAETCTFVPTALLKEQGSNSRWGPKVIACNWLLDLPSRRAVRRQLLAQVTDLQLFWNLHRVVSYTHMQTVWAASSDYNYFTMAHFYIKNETVPYYYLNMAPYSSSSLLGKQQTSLTFMSEQGELVESIRYIWITGTKALKVNIVAVCLCYKLHIQVIESTR